MKTKHLTLVCVIALFSVNLAYGRWPSVDPNAENYYPQSPYSYAGNNPVRNVDPDGRDWYSVNRTDDDGNKYMEYVYTDQYRSQRDLNKAGIDGTYIGITGKTNDGGQYLSLFGATAATKTADGRNNIIAEMVANIDRAVISSYKADYYNDSANRDLFNSETYSGATNMGVSMTITPQDVSRNRNIRTFDYAGGNVLYIMSNNRSAGSFSWGDGQIGTVSGYTISRPKGINAIINDIYMNATHTIWTFPTQQSWQNTRNRADKLLLNRKW